MKRRQRTAALLEVLGVYLAGHLAVRLLTSMLSLHLANPLDGFTVGITNAELIAASRQTFVLLMLQYAGWFLLIIPINWWHRRRGPAAYGLTRAGQSWKALLAAGLATAALVEWPVLSLSLVNSIHSLGETALKTVRAYLLKEAFQQLWDYSSPTWAGRFLDDWCRQVMRSRIEPMKKIARSLREHRELILNYFRAQKLLSSGVVEA